VTLLRQVGRHRGADDAARTTDLDSHLSSRLTGMNFRIRFTAAS
jgi:hypothetical protein